MARIRFNCAGFSQLSCVPHFNGRSPRVLILTLVVFAMLCVFAIMLLEHRSIQHRVLQKQLKQDNDGDSHFGIVLDCGSSGTRVYVYYWPRHSGNAYELLHIKQLMDKEGRPVMKKKKPGLSTFGKKPDQASDYIAPLLKYAGEYIPKSKHKETPLYILATAGMRMLPHSQQKAILGDLRTDIPGLFDFAFSASHVEVISGKLEGVYAWIAMNFALGRFEHSNLVRKEKNPKVTEQSHGRSHDLMQTVGIIDMGGGSAQIAYEITRQDSSAADRDIPVSLLAEFNLGCMESDKEHTYRVYVTTFLGYGANAAHRRHNKQLINDSLSNNYIANNTKRTVIGLSQTHPILDPCLPKEMTDSITVNNTHYYLKGVGDFKTCQKIVRPLLNLTVPCSQKPCSINGVYQPKVDFSNSEFYGFSEYWYSMEDVLRIGGKYNAPQFEKAASEFCSTKWSLLWERYTKHFYPKADQARFRTQCFKSAWISAALHDGFKFPRMYKNFQSAQFIDGRDVQWTLGALLYKTRHLPLREVEKKSHIFKPSWTHKGYFTNYQYLITFCIFIFAMAIILCVCRLRHTRTNMNRVPSMTYLMTDQGQDEAGINIQIVS